MCPPAIKVFAKRKLSKKIGERACTDENMYIAPYARVNGTGSKGQV